MEPKSVHALVYDASLEVFRAASKAFTKITLAYRAREIDDAAYLAGRRAFDEAMVVFDRAEQDFINAENALCK